MPDLTQANTAFVMTFQLGAIVGPPYAGAVMQALGVRGFPAGAGCRRWLLAVALLAAAARSRARRRP